MQTQRELAQKSFDVMMSVSSIDSVHRYTCHEYSHK